jgi:predicted nucleic acid-binding protein
MAVYVETSAFAKRYVHEPTSEAFDDFVSGTGESLVISPLTITEFESVLRRRLHQRDFDKRFLNSVRAEFERDLTGALWQVCTFDPAAFQEARRLLGALDVPLATLDALHLSSALLYHCRQFATSDRQLARAAQRSGLIIHDFSS